MIDRNDLINNIDKISTTELGIIRIKRNLELDTENVVNWCKQEIRKADNIYKKGKNWYVSFEDCIITVNASSYTIITGRKNKGKNK